MMTRWGHLPRALKLADERVVDYLPPLYTCTGMLYSPRLRRLAALGFVLWRQSRPEPFPLMTKPRRALRKLPLRQ